MSEDRLNYAYQCGCDAGYAAAINKIHAGIQMIKNDEGAHEVQRKREHEENMTRAMGLWAIENNLLCEFIEEIMNDEHLDEWINNDYLMERFAYFVLEHSGAKNFLCRKEKEGKYEQSGNTEQLYAASTGIQTPLPAQGSSD